MTGARESGPQRRKIGGRPLHACCMCGEVGLWGATWSWFGSLKDEDDGTPVAKFCTSICAAKAGANCINVTAEMKQTARDAEMRPPEPYTPPARPRTYADAADDQRRARERAERIAAIRRGEEA